MNIGIDITSLQTGHKDRGVGMYTKLLIEALQKYENKHSYYLFTRGQNVSKDAELIHYPYFDPFFITLPLFYQKPTVVTVHDFIPLVFPDHFPAGLRGSLKWQYQRMKLRRVKRIITDSEASKRDVMRIAIVGALGVDVIHLAPSPRYGIVTNSSLLSGVRKKYGLPEQFILYVGDVNWNKNVLGMLRAFQELKAQSLHLKAIANNSKLREIRLVLVGKAFLESSKEADQIASFIKEAYLTRDIISMGGVSTEDLLAIYNLASVYIQPSIYEGFGLPVLEAMACGVPVVASKTASLAEITGPAITIDPGDTNDIVRGLEQALTLTPEKRCTLVTAQRKWAGQYSWKRVAHETIQSYEKALA